MTTLIEGLMVAAYLVTVTMFAVGIRRSGRFLPWVLFILPLVAWVGWKAVVVIPGALAAPAPPAATAYLELVVSVCIAAGAVVTLPILANRQWGLETRLGKVLERSKVEIFVVDPDDFTIVDVSAGARTNLGYAEGELQGRPLREIVAQPEDITAFPSLLRETLRTGKMETLSYATVGRRKDGTTYPVELEIQMSSLRDRPVLVAVGIDTSDRVSAESERDRSEARYQSLFEDSPNAIMEQDFSALLRLARGLGGSVAEAKARLEADPGLLREAPGLVVPLDANAAAVRMFSALDREELLARNEDLYLPSTMEGLVPSVLGFLAGEVSGESDVDLQDLDGNRLRTLVRWRAAPGHEMDGSRVILNLVDVTQRKVMEEELARREAEFRALIEHGHDLITVISMNREVLFHSPSIERVLGYRPEERIGKDSTDLIHPEDLQHYGRDMEWLLHHPGQVHRSEVRLRHADGRYRTFETLSSVQDFPQGDQRLVVNLRDVTERVAADEERLRLLERIRNQLSLVVDLATLEGVGSGDVDGVNRAALETVCQGLGVDRVSIWYDRSGDGESFDCITALDRGELIREPGYAIHRADHPEYFDTLRSGRPVVSEDAGADPHTVGFASGYLDVHQVDALLDYPIRAAGTLRGILCCEHRGGSRSWDPDELLFVGEVGEVLSRTLLESDRKEAEEEGERVRHQLRQAQKMETIGTLAGGIAHDFNNILTPILGYAQLLKEGEPEDSRRLEVLDEITRAARRGADLVQQILTFGRQREQTQTLLSMEAVVDEAIQLVRASAPSFVEIRRVVDPEVPAVRGDPVQLHQVLMNLCTNAVQAMEDGGALTLRLRTLEVTPGMAEEAAALDPGSYVEVAVQDTGSGIGPEEMEFIFDPFFTTKEVGKGTGLGLSVAQGIVHSHGGAILVRSQPGEGAEFRVLVPAHGEPLPQALPEVPVQAAGPLEGRVLLVEDEEAIARLEIRMLERMGLKVDYAECGNRALELFSAAPERFDLVLTDYSMPGMNGLRLASEIRQRAPELPIVVVSGLGEALSQESMARAGVTSYMSKPFTLSDLRDTLSAALA